MKNIFKIHILFYFTAFICMITGHFKDFVWLSLLIFVHECGHATGAIMCRWKIKKIVLLPFGGMTYLEENYNRPIREELFILILGPCYQQLFFLLLYYMGLNNYTFMSYHYSLLLFNLLPMIPLDGSKLLELLLEKFFPYLYAKKITGYISIIVFLGILGLGIFNHQFLMLLILVFIFLNHYKYFRELPYVFMKFLMERVMHEYHFKRICKIKGCYYTKMRRGYKHIFFIDKWYTEREILKQLFKGRYSLTK